MSKSNLDRKKKLHLKNKRIRAFFLSVEIKKKKQEVVDEPTEDLYQDGMVYIQMKLPVAKITKEFEDKLKNKIEKKIIQVKIREASKEDLDVLKNIYNRSWLTSNTPYRPITKTDLLTILDHPDTIFLIGKVYGIDAGFVLLDFEGKSKEYAIIAALAVLPRFFRKGVGSVLGMASWDFLKQNYANIKEIRCEVYKENRVSSSFIKGIGFEEYGKRVYRKEDFEFGND